MHSLLLGSRLNGSLTSAFDKLGQSNALSKFGAEGFADPGLLSKLLKV